MVCRLCKCTQKCWKCINFAWITCNRGEESGLAVLSKPPNATLRYVYLATDSAYVAAMSHLSALHFTLSLQYEQLQ